MVTWLITGGASAGNFVIAWEDVWGGYDKDYNDLVIEITGVNPAGANPVPIPAAILLLGSELVGLTGISKKFNL